MSEPNEATEKVDEGARTVEFGGKEFRVADRVGLMPLMRFAHLARDGVDADDMEGLSAMYDLLRQSIADDEWVRFEDTATAERAGGEELMGVVRQAIEAITARPTSEPSGSSDGRTETVRSSADGSSSPGTDVIQLQLDRGRPDRAYVVDRARRFKASA